MVRNCNLDVEIYDYTFYSFNVQCASHRKGKGLSGAHRSGSAAHKAQTQPRTQIWLTHAHRSGSAAHTDLTHLRTQIWLTCAHKVDSAIHTLRPQPILYAHTHTQVRHPDRLSSSALPRQHRPGLGWGVGGRATMTFMFLYTHQQGALHACHLKHCPVNIDLAWGGGWGGGDNDVHVPLHTPARRPARLSS